MIEDERRGIIRSKSFYNKIILIFLSVMVIPIATIILLSIQTQKIVKNQITLSNQETLNQFFISIDQTVEEMKNNAVTILNKDIIKNYLPYIDYFPQKQTYKRYEIRNFLRSYDQQRYYDIFVYYPKEDCVISNTFASTTPLNYCELYYGERIWNYGRNLMKSFTVLPQSQYFAQ